MLIAMMTLWVTHQLLLLVLNLHTSWSVMLNKVNNINFHENDIEYTKVRTISSLRNCIIPAGSSGSILALVFRSVSSQCHVIEARPCDISETNVANSSYEIIDVGDQLYLSDDYDTTINKVKPNIPLPNGRTLLQQRVNGCLSYNRTWTQYENSFGETSSNFWIGLKTMHNLTANGAKRLRIDLKRFNGNTYWVEYSTFQVASAANQYQLTLSGYDTFSTVGDFTSLPNAGNGNPSGMKFSTWDQDNDIKSASPSCSRSFNDGGWWFRKCYNAYPHGKWRDTEIGVGEGGVTYHLVTGAFHQLAHFSMSIY